MNLLKIFRKSQNDQDKKIYTTQKIRFKSQCRKKRKFYYNNIETQLNFVNDSKSFWSLAREIRQENKCHDCFVNVDKFYNYLKKLLNPIVNVVEMHYAINYVEDIPRFEHNNF